jgi:hypothetical protein
LLLRWTDRFLCPSLVAGRKFLTGERIFSFIDLTKRQMDLLRGAFGKNRLAWKPVSAGPAFFKPFGSPGERR